MKTLTKIMIILTLAILPILLTSCNTELLDQLTSGKSIMELMMESGSADKGDGKVQIDFTLETDEGETKTVFLQLNICGGELALAEDATAGADIPLELTKEGYVFEGWFTAPDMTGVQVVDSEGNVINASVLAQCTNHECDGEGCIEIYAGFSPVENEEAIQLSTEE